MKNLLADLQNRLEALAPRERALVLLCAAVAAIALLYLLLWEPLAQARESRLQNLDTARALANRIEAVAAQAQGGGASASVNRNISLLAAVDQTSRSPTLGKAPSRLQPEGDREVKVWLEDVPFDNLLRWLSELDTRYGIGATSAEIERGSQPGTVSARLTLVRA
ncbi:MAG TPA: type II secretion system protein M [Solimonas sp.]